MEYIDKMKFQIEKLKGVSAQLKKKELQLNELNCKLKEKKEKVDLYREKNCGIEKNNWVLNRYLSKRILTLLQVIYIARYEEEIQNSPFREM